jgi:dTDP-glucose pyrophosphorylase
MADNIVLKVFSIKEALERLEEVAVKILFVVDDQRRVVGSVTDGDIRRGLLKGYGVDQTIDAVMNLNPVLKEKGRPFNFARMREKGVSLVPLVDGRGEFIGIEELSVDYPPLEHRAVIMAGGLGSRLGELTKDTPKPMLKVGNKPILHLIMERLAYAGVTNFYLSVNYRSEVIKDYFADGERFGWRVHYIEEPSRMGTAGSLRFFDDHQGLPFFVLNGDIISDFNPSILLQSHESNGSDFTIGVKDYSMTVPFGVVKGRDGLITHFEEKPKLSFDISAGFYVMNPGCLKHMPDEPYVDMPSFIKELIDAKMSVRSFSIDDYWVDVGHREDLLKAKSEVVD